MSDDLSKGIPDLLRVPIMPGGEMMTRKHFAEIADLIKDAEFASEEQRAEFARRMAWAVCKPSNPRFDTDRFLAACRRED